MGNGYVTPESPYTQTQELTKPTTYFISESNTETQKYSWCVVPQEVKRSNNTTIGITIKTPDGNEYYINDLSTIKVATTDNNGAAIKRWLPNQTYTYTFILSKTKIENITCSVAEWIPVTAVDIPIDLEK